MLLSLIIPCFNEEENIPYVAKKLEKIIQKNLYEVILVDNGSKDKTLEKLNHFFKDFNNVRILSIPKNEGYGNGILKGLEIARGELLAWTHADMQTDPNDVLEGLKYFKEHSGKVFVKGTRYGRPLKDVFFTMIAEDPQTGANVTRAIAERLERTTRDLGAALAANKS